MELANLALMVLKGSIVLTVFAVGLHAGPRDAVRLFRAPGELARALLSMYVIMPMVAVALALSFDLNPAVKVALVALSVSPVPPFLPRKVLKAGGTEDYMVGLLAAAALLAILAAPAAMEIMQRIFAVPLSMTPAAVAAIVLTSVLAPLAAGMALRFAAPTFAFGAAGALAKAGSLLLIAGLLPVLLGMGRSMFSLIGDGTLLAFAAFTAAGLASGHFLGGPVPGNRLALALSTASRHPGVAITIALVNFPGQKLTSAAVLLFLLVNLAVSALYLAMVKRRRDAVAGAGPKLAGGV